MKKNYLFMDMFIRQCQRCGRNKGINYYSDHDGKIIYFVCKDCRNKKTYE